MISDAAAKPAARMSAREGMPPAMARASCSALSAAVVTATPDITRRRPDILRPLGGVPGIILLERFVEIEDRQEIVARVGRLTDQEVQLDEREDDIAEIRRRSHAPVIQHEARQHAKAVERKVAARDRQLATGDVATLGQATLTELERGQHEEIGVLVETPFA